MLKRGLADQIELKEYSESVELAEVTVDWTLGLESSSGLESLERVEL